MFPHPHNDGVNAQRFRYGVCPAADIVDQFGRGLSHMGRLLPVTRLRKRIVTTCSAYFATDCCVATEWTQLREFHERMRWARQRAEFAKGKDAAEALSIKAPTYRTYERATDEGGRQPPLTEIQRIARRFKVSWEWLATGDGVPMLDDVIPPEVGSIWADIPETKREAALDMLKSLRRTGTGG